MPNRPVSQLIKNQRILTAAATLSVTEAAAEMRDARVGAVMVVNGPRLVGIFTERDALGPEMEQFEVELQSREHLAEIMG